MQNCHQYAELSQCRQHVLRYMMDKQGNARQSMLGVSAAHVIAVHGHLVLHEIGNVIKGERNA